MNTSTNIVTYSAYQISHKIRKGHWKRQPRVQLPREIIKVEFDLVRTALEGVLNDWCALLGVGSVSHASWVGSNKTSLIIKDNEHGYEMATISLKNGNISFNGKTTFMEKHTNEWKTLCVYTDGTKVYIEQMFRQIVDEVILGK